MGKRLAGLVGASLLAAASPIQTLAGAWVEIGPRTTFHFEPCGAAVCGVLDDSIYIKADPDARDVRNPDPAQRTRRLKGLTVLQQLVRADADWTGVVYIPSMGRSFPLTLTPVDANTLHFTVCLAPADCHTATLIRM